MCPSLLCQRFMIKAASHLHPIGFGVLLSGHQLRDLMQADLSCRQEGNQSAGEVLRERKSEPLQMLGNRFGRIGVWRVGHSESLSRVWRL